MRWLSRKAALVILLSFATAVTIVLAVRNRTVTFRGAVVRNSEDSAREQVIKGVHVTVTDGTPMMSTNSDASGAFAITVRRSFLRRRPFALIFRHAEYQPFEISEPVSDRLYVVRMQPRPATAPGAANQPHIGVGNVSVRYTLKTGAAVDAGSGLKTFQVVNKGNEPCRFRQTCSPDGKWQGSTASASLDAGPGNEFRDGRVSCLAGPCPFTKILRDDFSRGGRVISVSVLNWSDTTTFLLEAEAVRQTVTDAIRASYPVIFERAMNFSLPAAAEGICIEAEIDGAPIVFPIVPNPTLSWASCETQPEPEHNTLYRCELKPGYIFR